MHLKNSVDLGMDEFERLPFNDVEKKELALKILSMPEADASNIKIILSETSDWQIQSRVLERILEILHDGKLGHEDDLIEFFYCGASNEMKRRLLDDIKVRPEYIDILTDLFYQDPSDEVITEAIRQLRFDQKCEIFEWVLGRTPRLSNDYEENSEGLCTMIQDSNLTEPEIQKLRDIYVSMDHELTEYDEILDIIDIQLTELHEIESEHIRKRLSAMAV